MISSTNTVGTTPKDSSTAKAPKNRSAHTSHSYVSTAECRFSPASASPSCAASATGSPSRAAISSSEYPSASLGKVLLVFLHHIGGGNISLVQLRRPLRDKFISRHDTYPPITL